MILNKEELEEAKFIVKQFSDVSEQFGNFFIDSKRLERIRQVLYKRFVENETDGIQYSEEDFNSFETANLVADIFLIYSLKLKG